MNADQVLEVLQEAGLHVTLVPGQVLRVKPASHLTGDLRALIRSSKAQLIDCLTAAYNSTSLAPQPPENAMEWKELTAAYYSHHFNCRTCIAAGRGPVYGKRCSVGIVSWRAYSGEYG